MLGTQGLPQALYQGAALSASVFELDRYNLGGKNSSGFIIVVTFLEIVFT